MSNKKLSSNSRRFSFKEPEHVVRIYCNGDTEANYFNSLCKKLRLTSVKAFSCPHNRLSLVNHVKKITTSKRDYFRVCKYNHIYVVYDVDSLPKGEQSNPGEIKQQADNAAYKCNSLHYIPIVSNESFELWFLLHYISFEKDREIHRDQLCTILKEKIKCEYKKAKTDMIDLIYDKTQVAIDNAKMLERQHSDNKNTPIVFSKCNPYTNVYLLVEFLQNISKRQQ